MNKVLVWMYVYNEGKYISSTIDSILSQSFQEIRLLISVNQDQDDDTLEIVKQYAERDSRIFIIRPPTFLTGAQHGCWMLNDVLNKAQGFEYSCFVGGHDVLTKNYIKNLIDLAEANSNCVIAYGRSRPIDETGSVIGGMNFGPYIDMTDEIAIPCRPLAILTCTSFNVYASGLWRESARRQISHLVCIAHDHLAVAEMSLKGTFLMKADTEIYMRQISKAQGGNNYVKRHHPPTIEPLNDFAKQLSWARRLVRTASQEHPVYKTTYISDSLEAATLLSYLVRYIQLLSFYSDGPEKFYSDPKFVKLLTIGPTLNQLFSDFIDENY